MSYPIGSKVKIKDWVVPGYYGDTCVGNEVFKYKGQSYTVEGADYNYGYVSYRLCEDEQKFNWPEEILMRDPEVEDDDNKEVKATEKVLLGVSPDEPIVTNANGGKQSDTPYGFHLLPIDSLFAAAKVAKYGADKYGETFNDRNYTKIPTEDHINHAIQHLYAHMAGDRQDEHLAHAIVRVLFAYDVAVKAGQV